MRNLNKILVFSDVHLRSLGKTIIGLSPARKLEQALEHALEQHSDAGNIIFSGDLAHDGDTEAYKLLHEMTKGIEIPITFMMGNHDNRTTFSKVFPNVMFDTNGFLQSKVSLDQCELLCLDTLQYPKSSFNKNVGFLCEKRLAWLDRELRAAKQKKVIIFMHHPAFPVGFKAMDDIRLLNEKSFFSILDDSNNVVHLISGHIHRTISGYVNGYGFTIFKSTCHQMPMQCESENVKLSTVEPGAYGIIFISREGVIVHTEDFELQEKNKKTFDTYN